MADVAAAAGASVTTVSHVLNGTRPVSAELRARVLAAVEVTGYRTNTVARALATRNTMLIGVVMNFLSNPFFAPLLSSIEKVLRRNGYTLLLTDNHESPAEDLKQVTIMADRRVDGVILAPATSRLDPILALLAERDTPIVLVDRSVGGRCDEVGAENVEATAGLVAHLVEHGHTRIAFLRGRSGLSTTDERLAGYRLGLDRAGLSFDRRLVRTASSMIEPARSAVKTLMSAAPPTAIVAGNNAMAVGALRGLREIGARVPEDVAVVAYDDIEWADLMHPGLTAMAQPIQAMGTAAASLLIERIAGNTGPPRRLALPTTFRHRRSCGCPEKG